MSVSQFAKQFWISGAVWIFLSTLDTVSAGEEEGKLPHNETKSQKVEKKILTPVGLSLNCLVDETAIEDVRKSKEQNEAKARELAARESELKVKVQSLADQVKNLEIMRTELEKIQVAKKQDSDQKIQQVTDTVLSMSPKAAAKMLGTIDEKLSVEVVSRMDTQRLGKIMNLMDPAHSSRLSERLAGIRKTPGQVARKEGGRSHGQLNPSKDISQRAGTN